MRSEGIDGIRNGKVDIYQELQAELQSFLKVWRRNEQKHQAPLISTTTVLSDFVSPI